MAAKFDPNIELNPNPVIMWILIFVIAAVGTVLMIIKTGDNKPGSAAATAPK
jgi:hypothetical protein